MLELKLIKYSISVWVRRPENSHIVNSGGCGTSKTLPKIAVTLKKRTVLVKVVQSLNRAAKKKKKK